MSCKTKARLVRVDAHRIRPRPWGKVSSRLPGSFPNLFIWRTVASIVCPADEIKNPLTFSASLPFNLLLQFISGQQQKPVTTVRAYLPALTETVCCCGAVTSVQHVFLIMNDSFLSWFVCGSKNSSCNAVLFVFLRNMKEKWIICFVCSHMRKHQMQLTGDKDSFVWHKFIKL